MDAYGVKVSRYADVDEDLTDAQATLHFSLIRMYDERNQLDEMLFSENEHVRGEAENTWRQIDEVATLTVMEEDLGSSYGTPTREDIRKIEQLIALSSPFVVPEYEA